MAREGLARWGDSMTQEKINVRWGELLEPQDLIRIDSVVREVADTFRGLPEDEAVFSLWDYVCRKIRYPDSPPGLEPDTHVLQAFPHGDLPFFGVQYRIEKRNPEFWQYPSETLSWRVKDTEERFGNCEDTAICLCSLVRAYGIGPGRAWVVVGEIPPGRHAWFEFDGHILETTLSSAPNPAWRTYSDYSPAWRFNDVMRIGEIRFVPKGDERANLRWIGARWQHPTKGAELVRHF